MIGRKLAGLLAVTGAVVLALSTAGPALAASSQGQAGAQLAAQPAPRDAAIAGACLPGTGVTIRIYGYTGCRKYDTEEANCPWNEVFVIAPDNTIWHAWPDSGGWWLMPNNGKAYDTWNCYRNGSGQRQIEVLANGGQIWYSYYHNGAWRGWYRR